MRSYGWTLIQCDPCPYEKWNLGKTWKGFMKTQRKRQPRRQALEETKLPTFLLCISSLQNYEKKTTNQVCVI